MAVIKTEIVKVNNKEFKILHKCSSQGEFSIEIPDELNVLLNGHYDNQYLYNEYDKLHITELSKKLYDDIQRFRATDVQYELCIGVMYESKGAFSFDNDGISLYNKTKTKLYRSIIFDSAPGCAELTFDYHILLKKTENGHVNFYIAHKKDNANKKVIESLNNNRCYIYEDYIVEKNRLSGNVINDIPVGYILLPYSEKTIENLLSIQEQIRKASQFLFELVTNDNFNELIENNNHKLIT